MDDIFETRQRQEGLRVTTVTRIVALGGPSPVTVGTFQTRRPHEGPKVMTVTRIATPRRPTPVTVGTFEGGESTGRKVTTVTVGIFERFRLAGEGPYHGKVWGG